MAKKKSSRKAAHADLGAVYKCIGWAVAAGVWLLVSAALISYDPLDFPAHAYGVPNDAPQNWVGQIGALIAHKINLMVGPGMWVVILAGACYLGSAAIGRSITQPLVRALGVIVMAVSTSALVGVCLPNFVAGYVGPPEGPGGLLALYIVDQLTARFAVPGTLVVLGVCFWVGAVLAADRIVLAVPRMFGEMLLRVANLNPGRVTLPGMAFLANLRGRMPALAGGWFGGTRTEERTRGRAAGGRTRSRTRRENDVFDELDEETGGFAGTESFGAEQEYDETGLSVQDAEEDAEEEEDWEDDSAEEDTAEEWDEDAADDDAADDEDAAEDEDADAPGAYVEAKQEFDPEKLRKKMAQMTINFAPQNSGKGAQVWQEMDLTGYQFPSLDLLEEPEGNFTEEQERIVREQAYDLEGAMRQYKIEGEVVGIDSGPVITLFEVRLAPGTRVSRLSAIDSDLARALRAQNIRIVPTISGKDTVGIEVPNIKKERVRMKELMHAAGEKAKGMKLPMFLGKDASGNPLVQDLNAMPHMLIAGTTGSGKSVCMNSIILSFLYTKRPDELKLVLVDPKMVEMSLFKNIPHLMCPVVTEMSKAAAILEWAVTKMDERYELLAEAGVRDIATFNTLGEETLRERMDPATEEEWARIPKKLPYMVFVIDELADLMMTNKEVEGFIVRIAQKARAVGIHLILATQRPSANVVTGLIKSNMPCRVCMKVSSGMDSRIVLDAKGGELLLGHGDMLFLSPRSSELIRAQGCLVDDHEVRDTVKFLKTISKQSFEPQLVQMREGGGAVEGERDELFEDAVEVVMDTQRGSVSLLQRRLTIGYSRASRIIEQMEAFGILGAHKNAQAREVLVSREEWEAMKAQAAADAARAQATAPKAESASAATAEVEEDLEEALDLADGAEDEYEYVEYDEDEDDTEGSVPQEYDDEYRQ